MAPGPKSVVTNTVSRSTQVALPLASGRTKPSVTKVLLRGSNSRTTAASAPPRESETRQRWWPGVSQSAPSNTQFSFSAWPRASMSSTVSQRGEALRYSARVVRRQSPRGLRASRQKL